MRAAGGRAADVPAGAWWVWGLAAGFYLVALFHRMSLGVASFEAERRLDLAPGTVAVLSALQLALYLVMLVPAGLTADRLGPRRALAIGLAGIAVGEVAFGLTHSPGVALAGRALVGAGDAFIFLCVLRLAQSWFPARRFALLACLTALAGAVGQLATTVPLGSALDALGWTPVFAGSGLLTGALALACLRVIRDRPAREAGAGAAGAGAPGPVAHDGLRATLRMAWAQPGTRDGFWTHFGLMGPFLAITALWGYPYLVTAQGLPASAARAWLLGTVAVVVVASPVVGVVAGRRPDLRAPVGLATSAALTALWGATLLWPGGPPPGGIALGAFLATGLAGAVAMLAFDVAREDGPAHRAASVSALVNTGGFSAAVLGQLAVGQALRVSGVDLRVALWPLLGLMGLALVQLALRVRRAGPARAALVQPVRTEGTGGV
jgi:MFS family permease